MRRSLVVALLVFLAAPYAAADPSREAIAEARGHYKRGLEAYDAGRYDAALAEFLRADQLAPSYRILQSIGLVQVQLGDNAGAVASFERYLAEGGAQVDAATRAKTEKQIAELRGHVASILVTTRVFGATIAVDDVVAGTTPLAEPIVVNVGRRRVAASMHGYESETRVVVCAEKDKIELSFDLVPHAEPLPSAPPSVAESSPPPPPPPLFVPPTSTAPARVVPSAPPQRASVPWVGWAATGTLALAAGVTGAIALGALSDLHHAKDDVPSSSSELDSISSRAKAWALASDLCTASAVVVGGVSLYFTLRAAARNDAVRVGVAPGGVVLRGGF
jgi:hypothetical protein